MKSNIVLIGMPGAGKSTIGVLLAKALGKDFVDTDVLFQSRQGRCLQDIIHEDGLEKFLEFEEDILLGINAKNTVIATGGSAVYSEPAMKHLAQNGTIVYLTLQLFELQQRLTDLATRGVVMEPGEMLASVYHKRRDLYEKWADVTVDCSGLSHQQTLAAVLHASGLIP